jgi:hypothetical protein
MAACRRCSIWRVQTARPDTLLPRHVRRSQLSTESRPLGRCARRATPRPRWTDEQSTPRLSNRRRNGTTECQTFSHLRKLRGEELHPVPCRLRTGVNARQTLHPCPKWRIRLGERNRELEEECAVCCRSSGFSCLVGVNRRSRKCALFIR